LLPTSIRQHGFRIADLKGVDVSFNVEVMLVSIFENKTYCGAQRKGIDGEEIPEYATHSQCTSSHKAS
jgi:hypothetical protein